MIQLRYKNEFRQIISEEQANLMKSYSRETYEDSVLKFTEEIEGNNVRCVHYYLSPNEKMDDVLLAFDVDIVIYVRQKHGEYTIVESFQYKDSILMSRTQSILNKNLDNICFAHMDVLSNEIIQNSIVKYYYEPQGELKYLFDYNPDDTCFMITDQQGFADDIMSWEIGQPDCKFSWEGFEYYQFANPIIPE